MREQPPAERVKNFNEVALGFTEEEALVEAGRCLNCKKPPCIGGCPVEIDIPAFIQLILKKDFEAALDKIREKNSLPAICGRVCPQEDQCEKVCILAKKKNPINIGALERFAADWGSQHASACSVERATSDPSASSGSSRAKSRDD
jgi:glutamate synthase (NADPH/NADH) small chain